MPIFQDISQVPLVSLHHEYEHSNTVIEQSIILNNVYFMIQVKLINVIMLNRNISCSLLFTSVIKSIVRLQIMYTVIIYAGMFRFTDIGFTKIFTTLALYVLVFLYMC